MAGGFRKWGQNLSTDGKQSAWDHAKENAAQGMFNAREDIRQKLVDEGWTGRFQPDAKADLHGAYAQDLEPDPNAAPEQGTEMSDLYGEAAPDAEKDAQEPEM